MSCSFNKLIRNCFVLSFYLDTNCHWLYIHGYYFVKYKYLFVNMVSCMCITTPFSFVHFLPFSFLSLSLFPLYFLFISSLFPLHFLTIRMQTSLTWSMWNCMSMYWISCTILCSSSSTPSIQHGILALLMLPARPLKYSWMHVLKRYIMWQRSYNWCFLFFLLYLYCFGQ